MKFLIIVFAVFICMPQAWAEDPVGTHNMLLVGDQPIYASHLPMFTNPIHRYQAVFEVELNEAGNEIYQKDRAQSGSELYSFSPSKKFTMPALKVGDAFPADLFRGHLEMSGVPLGPVDITIKRVVHFHRFDESLMRPSDLTYFVIPSKADGKSYLFHWITTPTQGEKSPADQFDHILTASLSSGEELPAIDVGQTAWLVIGGSKDTFADRIDPAANVTPTGQLLGPASSKKVALSDVKTLYTHTGGDVRVR
jgi:hypothetical protein